ncbi:MAG: Rab family GTPase [Candidatus Hodarchaeales archaeon]
MGMFEIKDDLFKVCLVGDGSVGKTAIAERFLGKGFSSHYNLTIGTNICTHALEIDGTGTRVKFQIWDLAGQQRFEFVRSTFYRGSHAVVMVFDVTNPVSFTNLREWKFEILQNLGSRSIPLPVVLVGNKCDLQQEELIKPTEIALLREELKNEFKIGSIPFLYTSALSGMNITESFEALGHLLIQKRFPSKLAKVPVV